MTKNYLGDGVYVEIIAGEIVLTTSDGELTTNSIFLNSDVWESLKRVVEEFIRTGQS